MSIYVNTEYWPEYSFNEIFKFSPHFDPFGSVNDFCMNSLYATQITQLKNEIFGLVSRLLERDFVYYVATGSHMANCNW